VKNNLKALNKYFSTLAKRLKCSSDWQRAFKAQCSMIGYLNRVPILLLGRSGRTWILASFAFAKFAFALRRHSGFKGLAVYLKVATTLLLKAVAGAPIKGVASSLGHRVAVTRSGLPKMIPQVHRKQILRGDGPTIRFWLSVLSLYRVIDYLGKPKLRTITSPGKVFDLQVYKGEIPRFFETYSTLRDAVTDWKLPQWTPVIITKSGPGVIGEKAKKQFSIPVPNSTAALILQAAAWESPKFKELRAVFRALAFKLKQQRLWMDYESISKLLPDIRVPDSFIPEYLGKLGTKDEPGKVRVFAMVDWWSQMLLRPLHKKLFEVLETIPTDATFDQDAGVLRGMKQVEKTAYAASFDLSAATDRLPLSIQTLIIDHIYPGAGELWGKFLVEREYSIPRGLRGLGMKMPKSVHYAVGQPMGALSSWAMLALTHHFIVQMAARRVYPSSKGWFTRYLVLGDDNTIFDRAVAAEYLRIMADLGVEINLVKSVVSTTSFEFAKRFIHKGQNLSPVSFKELDVAAVSLDAAVLLFQKFAEDKEWSLSSFMKLRGAGFRVLSKLDNDWDNISRHWKGALLYLSSPGKSWVSFSSWMDWISSSALGKSNPGSVSLDAVRDIAARITESSKPTRLRDLKQMISAPELGAGLRPDSNGVLRYTRLFRLTEQSKQWIKDERDWDRILQASNRLLYKTQLQADLDKRQLNEMWKELALFADFTDEVTASDSLQRLFDTVEFAAMREKDPDIRTYRSDPVPSRLAPRILRIYSQFAKSRV